MFRRRGFVRPVVRSMARQAMMPEVPPLLRRANELMAAGNYIEAAAAFEQLARGAQARGIPRDVQLFLQAGRARILAGQVPAGMIHIQQGLALLAARGQWPNFDRAGQRVVADLNQRGLANETKQIEDYIKATLPAGFTAAPAAGFAGKPKPVLPTNCPGCGAPVRADEVEWVDEVTAECQYCGSAVRAE